MALPFKPTKFDDVRVGTGVSTDGPAGNLTGFPAPRRFSNDFAMVDNFLIDVATAETHGYESDVTNHPVESGSTISDNIRQQPIKVTIDGIVSNTPLEPLREQRIAASMQFNAAQSAHAHFTKIWEERRLVTIRTSLATFTNMAMTSYSVPRASTDGIALHFSMSFQEVQIVKNTSVGPLTSKRGGGSGGKRKYGAKPPMFRQDRFVLWRFGEVANPILVLGRKYEGTYWKGGGVFRGQGEGVFFDFVRVDSKGEIEGAWYHNDRRTPLDARELKRFGLDLQRDRNARVDSQFAPEFLNLLPNNPSPKPGRPDRVLVNWKGKDQASKVQPDFPLNDYINSGSRRLNSL